MKKLQFFLLFCGIVFYGCNSRMETTMIVGEVGPGVPDGMVYIIDVSKQDLLLDSTTIKNGSFNMKLKDYLVKHPFEAAIVFRKGSNLAPIGYNNLFKSRRIQSTFYIEKGITKISGELRHEGSLANMSFPNIVSGKQNEVFYQYNDYNFGHLENSEQIQRLKQLTEYRKIIAKHPYSFYLLKQLKRHFNDYSDTELQSLLVGFDSHVASSQAFQKLQDYAKGREGRKEITNFILTTPSGDKLAMINDRNAKVHLVVIWASWCLPCREEIPMLKKLYADFQSKGLSISSISIDNNFTNWQTALNAEKMPWNQFIVNQEIKEKFEIEYQITSIPLNVFVDTSFNIIKRVEGNLGLQEYEQYLLNFGYFK